MVERVAVGRIVAGHGDGRVVVMPGERFNTDTLKIGAEDVRRMELSGVIRRARDDVRVPAVVGPGATTEEEPPAEGNDGGDGGDGGDDQGTRTAATRGRAGRKPSDLDL